MAALSMTTHGNVQHISVPSNDRLWILMSVLGVSCLTFIPMLTTMEMGGFTLITMVVVLAAAAVFFFACIPITQMPIRLELHPNGTIRMGRASFAHIAEINVAGSTFKVSKRVEARGVDAWDLVFVRPDHSVETLMVEFRDKAYVDALAAKLQQHALY